MTHAGEKDKLEKHTFHWQAHFSALPVPSTLPAERV